MNKIAMLLAYDGAPYAGWQRQPQVPTVQSEIEQALARIHQTPAYSVTAASRTDAGVHAQGQIVVFETDKDYEEGRWLAALNALTPRSILVRKVCKVSDDFNPRFHNRGKHYRYTLWRGYFLPPVLHNRAVHAPHLCVDSMREAAAYLVGNHDFQSFRAQDCQAKNSVRHIHEIRVEVAQSAMSYPFSHELDALIHIDVKGTAFLKQMVRIIAGTLVTIGEGKQPPIWAKEVLDAKDRAKAGRTLPPQGLELLKVYLDDAMEAAFADAPITFSS